MLKGNFLKHGPQHFAWAAPFSPKVHQDWLIRLEHFRFEVCSVDFNGVFHNLISNRSLLLVLCSWVRRLPSSGQPAHRDPGPAIAAFSDAWTSTRFPFGSRIWRIRLPCSCSRISAS